MSSIISSENYVEHALKMSSASRDWRLKGLDMVSTTLHHGPLDTSLKGTQFHY